MIFLILSPGITPPAVEHSAASLQSFAPFVSEAAQRFGIPEDWIYAVIWAESHGNVVARSPKGALGLMQLMPGTWESLRDQLGLGNDPLDAHDNILAGTAYLRQLYDRYGPSGFLAAYNAGPGRYEDWLRTAKPLPLETRTYAAALAKTLNLIPTGTTIAPNFRPAVSWQTSAIFIPAGDANTTVGNAAGFQSSRAPFVIVPSPPSSP